MRNAGKITAHGANKSTTSALASLINSIPQLRLFSKRKDGKSAPDVRLLLSIWQVVTTWFAANARPVFAISVSSHISTEEVSGGRIAVVNSTMRHY